MPTTILPCRHCYTQFCGLEWNLILFENRLCWLKYGRRHRRRILSGRLCLVVHYITALSAQLLVVMSKTQRFWVRFPRLATQTYLWDRSLSGFAYPDRKYFMTLWNYCIQYVQKKTILEWWRRQMETFSASLAICAGNSPVTGEFPAQRPVTRSFEVFFDLRRNKRFSKRSWGWRFETLSRPLWCHCNGFKYSNPF